MEVKVTHLTENITFKPGTKGHAAIVFNPCSPAGPAWTWDVWMYIYYQDRPTYIMGGDGRLTPSQLVRLVEKELGVKLKVLKKERFGPAPGWHIPCARRGTIIDFVVESIA